MAKQMLDEYVRGFWERNSNLYLFNAVMHLDETSPHLHLDFVPYYTRPRQRGLRCGVSMKQALIEQGFVPQGRRANQLVAWEERERNVMEAILRRHGFAREDKQAHHKHMSVKAYKDLCETKKEKDRIAHIPEVPDPQEIRYLYEHVHELETENRTLRAERSSPYRAFYYLDADKQAFVQTKMTEACIPFRETENGFEAQVCFVDRVRRIEKQYRPPYMSYREKLRDDVDRILMQSQDLEELLQRMAKIGYEIKRGKYLAVRPKRGENFIRLRSLGEHYSEFALKNRLRAKARAEHDLVTKITAETDQDTPRAVVLRTMRFYTVTFAKGALPMRRKVAEKPFSWTNDAELDKLLRLNRLVNEGATLDSLRRDLVAAEQRYAGYKASLEELSEELRFDLRLKDAIGVVFEGKCSTESSPEQAAAMLRRYPQIRRDNYRNVDTMIASTQARYQTVETAIQEAEQARKEAADLMTAMERVMGGTYVQTLVAEEQQRRVSELLPNGTTMV